eukprot:10829261-Prorocentrum_lima.AAC.1
MAGDGKVKTQYYGDVRYCRDVMQVVQRQCWCGRKHTQFNTLWISVEGVDDSLTYRTALQAGAY